MGQSAILSSYKKDGELIDIAKLLLANNYTIFASGGTYKFLTDNGFSIKNLNEITNIENIQDGRVKTLSPLVYEAILRKSPLDNNNLLKDVEVVYVNLYPFPEDGDFNENIELIDIGGVTLLRAAAKNIKYVVPILSLEDLKEFLNDKNDMAIRIKLAKKTFSFTSYYDSIIANSIEGDISGKKTLPIIEEKELKYGENPQDKGILWRIGKSGLYSFETIINKKGMSFNNYYDAYIAAFAISKLKKPACSVVKHGNPIGISEKDDIETAFNSAIQTDELSSFGGIFAFNRPLPDEFLLKLADRFFEVLIVPEINKNLLEFIFKKRKNLRILVGDVNKMDFSTYFRGFDGLILKNISDKNDVSLDIKLPCPQEKKAQFGADMVFGLNIARAYTSNSMILVKEKTVVGAGFGMPNRVEALKRAIDQAGEKAKGSVLISDGFIPFTDSVELAADAGIELIVQPGGSLADKKVIEKARELKIGMVFTGKRYFRH